MYGDGDGMTRCSRVRGGEWYKELSCRVIIEIVVWKTLYLVGECFD